MKIKPPNHRTEVGLFGAGDVIGAVFGEVVGASVVVEIFIAVVVVVVILSPQFEGSLSSGGLLAPDLHPWQGFLSGGQEEWRRQTLGKDE